jgi:hypothetical protein
MRVVASAEVPRTGARRRRVGADGSPCIDIFPAPTRAPRYYGGACRSQVHLPGTLCRRCADSRPTAAAPPDFGGERSRASGDSKAASRRPV